MVLSSKSHLALLKIITKADICRFLFLTCTALLYSLLFVMTYRNFKTQCHWRPKVFCPPKEKWVLTWLLLCLYLIDTTLHTICQKWETLKLILCIIFMFKLGEPFLGHESSSTLSESSSIRHEVEPAEAIATGANACLNILFLFFTCIHCINAYSLLFVVTYTEISNHNTTEDQNPFVPPKQSEYWLLLCLYLIDSIPIPYSRWTSKLVSASVTEGSW